MSAVVPLMQTNNPPNLPASESEIKLEEFNCCIYLNSHSENIFISAKDESRGCGSCACARYASSSTI